MIFILAFFTVYWLLSKKGSLYQNILLLLGNSIFYCWVDWRFFTFLVLTISVNFFLGKNLGSNPNKKKLYLNIGVIYGIGSLAFFKYYNFFIESFNKVFSLFDVEPSLSTLKIIIPIGISFFTFKALSYLLDINKGKIQPTTNYLVFFNFISFFPTILSGPIDGAKKFIPQLEEEKTFVYSKAVDGLKQILWGLFKKLVISNTIAVSTTAIFADIDGQGFVTLIIGCFLYTIQIYTDFSGYSDIAIGVGRLLGFDIMKNFNFPLFAQNIADFWRKWHISLTSWLTEYVFTPLSIRFRDYANWGLILAIVINFTIIGIWHGPRWTYILFGFLHGIYYIPLILMGKINKKKKFKKGKILPSLTETWGITKTFTLVMFTFVFFKVETITQGFDYFERIFLLETTSSGHQIPKLIFLLCFVLLVIEWLGKHSDYAIQSLFDKLPRLFRWPLFIIMIALVLLFNGEEQQFIYFQF